MEFNFTRTINLIVRFVLTQGKTFITILAAISGVILFISFLSNIGSQVINYDVLVILFYILTFIAGLWFSSHIFSEMHQPVKSYKYFTLPASNLEKLVSSWLLSSPGIIVFSYILIQATSWVLAMFCNLLLKSQINMLDVVSEYNFGKIALIYIAVQPIFLLGATLFRKNNFFKTILSIIALGFVVGMVTSLFGYILYPTGFRFQEEYFMQAPAVVDFFEGSFVKTMKWVFWGLTGPFFMVVAYFKLKESEI